MPVSVGMKGRAEAVVTQDNAAVTAGSGTLPVFATPWMCALMEKASWTAVAPGLEPGESTVGTRLNITHISASPAGDPGLGGERGHPVDGKRIELKVAAYDQAGKIGEGTHQRFIVTDDRFLAKAARKLEG